MKTRIVAAIGVAALALAVTGAVLLGLSYNSAIAAVPDDSGTVHVAPVETTPSPTATFVGLPLPTEADIPADFDADRRAAALEWLQYSAIVDQCMADAGYEEWTYSIYWQPGYDPHTNPADWINAFEPSRQAGAQATLWGSTGAGADYHWDDAGCAGYATHVMGLDDAN